MKTKARHSLYDGIELETQFLSKDDAENPTSFDALVINYECKQFPTTFSKTFGEYSWDNKVLKLRSVFTVPLVGWTWISESATGPLAEDVMELAIAEIIAPPHRLSSFKHFLVYWQNGEERSFLVVNARHLKDLLEVNNLTVAPTEYIDPTVRASLTFLLKSLVP